MRVEFCEFVVAVDGLRSLRLRSTEITSTKADYTTRCIVSESPNHPRVSGGKRASRTYSQFKVEIKLDDCVGLKSTVAVTGLSLNSVLVCSQLIAKDSQRYLKF
jgi:hypothetical protein